MINKHTKSKAYGATETLEELVDTLKTRVDLFEAPVNIPGYCACSEQDFPQVSAYVAQELAIRTEDIYEIDISTVLYKLYSLLEQIQYDTSISSPKLVLVRGIEARDILDPHGYDQSMVQTSREHFVKNPPPTPKKNIVLTNIGYSKGEQKYYDFKEDARRVSQFKQFYWEF